MLPALVCLSAPGAGWGCALLMRQAKREDKIYEDADCFITVCPLTVEQGISTYLTRDADQDIAAE